LEVTQRVEPGSRYDQNSFFGNGGHRGESFRRGWETIMRPVLASPILPQARWFATPSLVKNISNRG
jgi:hypothetical protein